MGGYLMAKNKTHNITYPGYFFLPRALTIQPDFISLSGNALKLLIALGSQYNGSNNGNLCAALSVMRPRGWNSNNQLTRAKKELISKNIIQLTKKGSLGIGPDLFGITWQPIDECRGIPEIKETRTPSRNLKEVTKIKTPHLIVVQ